MIFLITIGTCLLLYLLSLKLFFFVCKEILEIYNINMNNNHVITCPHILKAPPDMSFKTEI